LGLLDGAAIADKIRHVRPEVPIVMLVDHVELPVSAFKSVDALVVTSDGPHFLLATVHFILNVKPAQRQESRARSLPSAHRRHAGRSRGGKDLTQGSVPHLANDEKDAPFSREVWRNIRDGTVQI
jgi:hypothetical protein